MDFKFDAATFEMIQNLAYPLVTTLTGFNPEEWVGEKSELFINVGDAFSEVAALFTIAGTALEDGKVSAQELEEIIAKAKDLPAAIDEIVSFFDDEGDIVVEEPEA